MVASVIKDSVIQKHQKCRSAAIMTRSTLKTVCTKDESLHI